MCCLPGQALVGDADVSPRVCLLCSQSAWNCSEERSDWASWRGNTEWAGPGGWEAAQRVCWSPQACPQAEDMQRVTCAAPSSGGIWFDPCCFLTCSKLLGFTPNPYLEGD